MSKRIALPRLTEHWTFIVFKILYLGKMLVTLKIYHDIGAAQIDQAKLNQAGIPCFLQNETTFGMMPIQPLAIQLKVHPEDLEVAHQHLHEPYTKEAEDYRDIGSKEIAYLKRQSQKKAWNPRISPMLIVLLIIPTLLALYLIFIEQVNIRDWFTNLFR
jgi:hypothetical protein